MAKKTAVAQKHGAQRNGRATRVREYLSQQSAPKTARQILDATEPGGDICLMTAALGTLFRGEWVEKRQPTHGQVLWTISKRNRAPRCQSTRRKGSPAAQKPKARPKRKQTPALAPAPSIRGDLPPTEKQGRRRPTRAIAPHAEAPLSVTKDAESVEAFLRRGGRIDILRPDECSRPLQFDHSDRPGITPVGPALHLIGAG